MRIAFDAYAFHGESYYRGIGRYTFSLMKALLADHPEHEIILFNTLDNRSYAEDFGSPSNFQEVYYECGRNEFLKNVDAFEPVYGDLVRGFIHIYKIDAFVCTSCFNFTQLIYRPEWFCETTVCAIFYDLIPYLFPNEYLPNDTAKRMFAQRIDYLHKCDIIFSISEFSKTDLIRHMHFDGDKIVTIMGAASDSICETPISEAQQKQVNQRFGITGNYILCTGGNDYRKNLDGLIIGYGKMSKALQEKYQLVIVCRIEDAEKEHFSALYPNTAMQDRVIFTGWITDEELLVLYNKAALMAFPSRYEGLGMPILEAWQCGVPVLTGNNSSLQELGKGAAVLVDADSPQDIAKGLTTALAPEMLAKNAALGKERVKMYTWSNSAHALERAIVQRAGWKGNKDAALSDTIAVFSAMPKQSGELVNPCSKIITALADRVKMDVFVQDVQNAAPVSHPNMRILPAEKYVSANYSITVYQIEDDVRCAYMLPYLQQSRGIVELFDENLAGLAQCFANRSQEPSQTLRNILAEDYSGIELERYVYRFMSGRSTPSTLVNGFVTNYADKLIVHGEGAKRKCLTLHPFMQIGIAPLDALASSLVAERLQNLIFEPLYAALNEQLFFAIIGHMKSEGYTHQEILPVIHTLAATKNLCGDDVSAGYFADLSK